METVLYREEGLALTEEDGELFLHVGAEAFAPVEPGAGLIGMAGQ